MGEGLSQPERIDMLLAMADAAHGLKPAREAVAALVEGVEPKTAAAIGNGAASDAEIAAFAGLRDIDTMLAKDHELPAILKALDGRFIQPVQGGDILRTPQVLPTGATCMVSIRSVSPAPSRCRMVPGRRSASSTATCRTGIRSRIPSPSSCGAPTM